jgi:hypothetical protein
LSNDIWQLSGTIWDWIDGSQSLSVKGFYGTLDVTSNEDWPGSRAFSTSWTLNITDAVNPILYLFGGYGYDNNGKLGEI